MRVLLMHPDRDFDLTQQLPWNEEALTQDLELPTLFEAMALGDKFLYTVARQAVLAGLSDAKTIRYRQEILKDCLRNPGVIRDIYSLPLEAIANKRKQWLSIFGRHPSAILSSALGMLEMFVVLLRRLREIAEEHAAEFESEGFVRFFAMIKQELDDDYFLLMRDHLQQMRFPKGVLLSAQLGQGNEGTNYVLRRPVRHSRGWLKSAFGKRSPVYSFKLHPRDDHGARALAELKDTGLNLVANAVAQSADHIESFFGALRTELAFYIGCLNLHEQLVQLGEPTTFPLFVGPEERAHSFVGLYDVCLALTMKRKVVGNDVQADGKDLFIITGANQGGKSVFLRSIGLAQLMMQCGMFVPAESFSANGCRALFTHYKREEDPTMKSGKLDEELARMSAIVDQLSPDSMVLFNESLAATNEREGSEIARQIVSALLDRRVKVLFVTHLYELARGFYEQGMANAIFLRAERLPDGTRTFRLIAGEPLETSFGQDVYRQVFLDGRRPEALSRLTCDN